MYAPPSLELHPKVLGRIAYCAEPARHSLAENTSSGEPPLVAFQYHQKSVKGNNIYCPGRGGRRGVYRERLAIMASPIVAFAEGFVER